MHVHVRLGLIHFEDVCNASTVRLNLAPRLFQPAKKCNHSSGGRAVQKKRVHPRPRSANLQPAVPKRVVIMQSNNVLRSCGLRDFTAGNAKDQCWKLGLRCYLFRTYLSSSRSQASVVAVPEQRYTGRVEGIRLHDRFRIALEESVALVSGGIAMRGRLSGAKRNGRKVQC